MNKIRVLLNLDYDGSFKYTYSNHLSTDEFDIDTRLFDRIGEENSADTLTEYDIIVFNFLQPIGYNHDRTVQLLIFLNSNNKIFIFFLNKHKESNNRTNTGIIRELAARINGKSWDFIYITPSGSQFQFTDTYKREFIHEYLSLDKKYWRISFYDNIYDFIKPIACNTDKNIVAFSIVHESVNAKNFFLPWIHENQDLFWKSLVEYSKNLKLDYTGVDQWVEGYSFPRLRETDSEIRLRSDAIKLIEDEIIKLSEAKTKYERIRNVLLYLDGDLLTQVCKEVLLELGLNVDDGKKGREDLVYINGEKHFLFEVKGCEKSASKNHIKQVNSHKTEYSFENEVEPKGILLINAWRKLPFEERGTTDKPIFPNELMNLVTLYKIALMTTQQLFVIYCANLENNFDKNEFIERLYNTIGIFEGFENIADYKLN